MRQSLQVMVKDPVDRMNTVEDAQHDRGLLAGQPVETLTDHIVEAAIGPSLYINELGVRRAMLRIEVSVSHGDCPFRGLPREPPR